MVKNLGFTLIELLIVIAIIAIGAAIAVPQFSNYIARSRLKNDAQNVYSLLQEAKMLSIKEQTDIHIFFDTSSSPIMITVFSGPGANETWDNGGDDIFHSRLRLHPNTSYGHGNATTPAGNSFGSDHITYAGNDFTFNARGMSNKSGYTYIQNHQNNSYAIGSLITGMIRLLHWNSGNWR